MPLFPTTVADYLSDAIRLDADAFAHAFPYPLLLHPVEAAAEARAFATQAQGAIDEGPAIPTGGPEDLALAVLGLKRRPGSPYDDAISIGRAATNDLVLPYQDVSKLHAYFTWSPDRATYFVADAGSANGTWLNAEPLAPKQAVALPDGARLRFGRYVFVFVSAASLHALLRRLPR